MFKTRKLRTLRLTAGAPTEHGQSLENHFMEEESNRFIFQLVLQQVAVVIHIPALAGNGDPLKKENGLVTYTGKTWQCSLAAIPDHKCKIINKMQNQTVVPFYLWS